MFMEPSVRYLQVFVVFYLIVSLSCNPTPSQPPTEGLSRRSSGEMFEKIVAGVDAEPGRAGRVVEAAELVARASGAEVLVAHVQELELTAAIAATPRAGSIHPLLGDDSVSRTEAFVDLTVERLRRAGIGARGVVQPGKGSTSKELLQIAESFGATLIVVGDRGQRVADTLLGGVAQKILRDADCSVLLVR
jgi:nucleotide-binding universal stress UspA family protein